MHEALIHLPASSFVRDRLEGSACRDPERGERVTEPTR